MNSMQKIRLALLGCGDVAQRDYLPEFHRLAARAEIVAVCGRGETRARQTAERYSIPKVYTDYTRMLADADVDAVINLLPMQLHYESTLTCLQAGKHVYTEKTVAGQLDQAQRLQQVADARGLTLVCAPCCMVWPQIMLARQLLQQDAIGAIHSARGLGHGGVPPWSGFTSDPAPFFAEGGGPQRDMGVYPLHALTGLLGAVRSVLAIAIKAQDDFVITDGPFNGQRVPIVEHDTWLILLEHEAGPISTVEANNSVQATHAAQLELFGLRGTLALNLIDGTAPVQLSEGGRWRDLPVPHARESGPDHILGVAHLVDCLGGQLSTPVLNIAHAAHVVEILDAAAQSVREGRKIALVTRF